MKIDTSSWQYFHLYDIFDIDSGTKLDKIKMNFDRPEVNFVGRANSNQGISAKIAKIKNIEPYRAGYLTLALGGAYLGSCFVQKEPFYTSQNVVVLIPKYDISELAKQFICTVIFIESQLHYKAFINELNRHIKKDFIFKLPVLDNGTPNWQYMEDYMKNIEKKVNEKILFLNSRKQENKKINNLQWKKFKIEDLFSIKKPSARSQSNYDEGEVPFVASGNYNNGVLKFLTPKNNEQLDKGNCITVSPVDGSAFYQKDNFLGRGGAGSSILILYNDKLNLYNGYFICAVIKTLFQKYHYSDMLNGSTIKEEMINLPVTSDNQPDWKYMEQYMKDLERKAKNNLSCLKNCI